MDERFKLQNGLVIRKSKPLLKFEITIRPEGICFSKSFKDLLKNKKGVLIGFDSSAKEICMEMSDQNSENLFLIYNCKYYYKLFNKNLISFLFEEFKIPKGNKIRVCGKMENENTFIFDLKAAKIDPIKSRK